MFLFANRIKLVSGTDRTSFDPIHQDSERGRQKCPLGFINIEYSPGHFAAN